MTTPTTDELREHLAYEVHYLVLAAKRFVEMEGREAVMYQDSALLHARNLLEFTNPDKRPRHGWWIADIGAPVPTLDPDHEAWVQFINSNVSHLGPRRTRGSHWPAGKTEQRLVHLATYVLGRIDDLLPGASQDPTAQMAKVIATTGLQYLRAGDEMSLQQIARWIDDSS